MKKKNQYKKYALVILAFVIGFVIVGYYYKPTVSLYSRGDTATSTTPTLQGESLPPGEGFFLASTTPWQPTHQPRPEAVKGIYISSWVAGTASIMNKLIALVDRTELNTVVIDIKDATGEISFKVNDPDLKKQNTDSKRISDIEGLIKTLHEKGIYVIGRVSTFQDPLFAKLHPELAVIRKSDGKTWRDRKGLSWLDAGAKPTWEYILSIAKESYSRGFDEINFDYIRFPTDGDMENVTYRFYDEKTLTKPAQMKLFYAYLHSQLSGRGGESSGLGGGLSSSLPIPHSADLFGMTTTAEDDMGIGQVFGDALPYFDYVAPMVYPSHYGPGIAGYKKPAEHPYEMIAYAMKGALDIASTTGQDIQKIVPWLQDFDMGATYNASMVRAQIKAVNDAGLTSWLLWDAANHYTESALRAE